MMTTMRIKTAAEVSAEAVERWRRQYADWGDNDTFADGTTLGSKKKQLNEHHHTPENIERILNEGWAKPECSCCDSRKDRVVEIQEAWGDRTFSVCRDCLAKINLLMGASK